MCTNFIQVHRREPSPWDYYKGFHSGESMLVPCGKCFECLKARRNDIMVRCYNEAKKYECAHFLTFTYNNEVVPIASSVYQIDKDSGEEFPLYLPELLEDRLGDELKVNEIRAKVVASEGEVYSREIDYGFDDKYSYIVRYSTSLNSRDIRLLLKWFRTRYKRENGTLPQFSYCLVGEYGNSNSRRPHYHLLLFSNQLTRSDIDVLQDEWKRRMKNSFTYYEFVNAVNKDGSNALSKVCSYLGKYIGKGTLEKESVRLGYTLKNRLCASKKLGCGLSKNLINFYQCQDVIKGGYDIDNPPESQLLLESIVERLNYKIDGFTYKLPLSLKKEIFGFRSVAGRGCWSKIYYMASDYLRNKITSDRDREFFEYVFNQAGKGLALAVCEFNNMQKVIALDRDARCKAAIIKNMYNSKI